MRKGIAVLSLALMLGGAAVAAAATATPAETTPKPVLLAQIDVTPADGRGERFQRPLPSPEQRAQRRADMCLNLHARAAGRLAEQEVRLELTAGQRAAFNRWRDVRLAAAQRRAETCATAPMGRGGPAQAAPSPVDRLARQEQMLRQRLADLTAERPALEALYNSLTPEQRAKFRPAGAEGRGPMRQRTVMMLRDRMGPRGGDVLRGRGPGLPPGPPAAR